MLPPRFVPQKFTLKNTQKMMTKSSLVFPTLAAASGATGVPIRTLRSLKAAGCPGFDAGGRVDVAKLLKWAVTSRKKVRSAEDPLAASKATLNHARAKQIEREASIATGTMLPTAEIERVCWFAAYAWEQSLPGVCEEIAQRLAPDGAQRVKDALHIALRNAQANITSTMMHKAELPDFVIEAFKSGNECATGHSSLADFKARGEAIAKVIAAATGKHLEAILKG